MCIRDSHENEVAQNMGACGCAPAKYWLHSNMLLMNGRKMSKSDGNTITPHQLFTGESEHVDKGFSPMVIRFFLMQAHYRSTIDLSNDALIAAEKGYKKLMEANQFLQDVTHTGGEGQSDLDQQINKSISAVFEELNDDFNTPKAIARLFELVPIINSYKDGKEEFKNFSSDTMEQLKKCFTDVLDNILGLKDEASSLGSGLYESLDGVMQLVLDLRQQARANKDWSTSDKIRDALAKENILVKDGKEGSSWSLN